MKPGRLNFLLLFILLGLSGNSFRAAAQDPQVAQSFHKFLDTLQAPSGNGSGTIAIRQDSRIVDHIISFNETFNQKKGIPGYRILIFFASGRDARAKMRAENDRFVKLYENVLTYWDYDPPYFKIYVGDFHTRSEAEKFKQEIMGHFPKAFVRPARLKVPDLTK